MSTRHSTTETAEQKLSRLQEESERANQKAVEMAKAVADAKAESEAEAKRVLEEKTAIEAKKKLEAKRKAETKRKSLKKGPDDDYEAGSSSKALRRAADGDSAKPRRSLIKTPAIVPDDADDDATADPNRIVEGDGWPSCLGCIKAKLSCKWRLEVANCRLRNLPSKAKNCEECVRKHVDCHFIWEGDDGLKRVAEDALEQGGSKRVQLEYPVELVNCLTNIGNNLGVLVKYAVSQSTVAREENQATTAMFEALQASLEGIQDKLGDN